MAPVLITILLLLTLPPPSTPNPTTGKWKLLKTSIGVSAMHMALLPNDRIITFDRTDFGPSNITFPAQKCPPSLDCYAHSVEFYPAKRGVRPLTILSDTWCSSGALLPDGVLIQSGGNNDGERVVRTFSPCDDCDWVETRNGLVSPRWYASNQLLPDGKVIVVGGRRQFTYEFIPKTSNSVEYLLPFLEETIRSDLFPNNLYPFTHLNTDGSLFIFANNRAILLDYLHNKVIRNYPVMPGGVSRNYPSTGSSVLLPLNLSGSTKASPPAAEVFICGGTVPDAIDKALANVFVEATKSCGRLRLNDDEKDLKWEMTEMPLRRIMGDMLLLPTGEVLIINGAARGAAGWDLAREPVLQPVLYEPGTKMFRKMSSTTIPRMYHSSAHLLSDGRVIVGGSNPNANYNFSALFPTELSVEAFSPPYLLGPKFRPNITAIVPGMNLVYEQKITVNFRLKGDGFEAEKLAVTMMAPSFTTHSFSMNQRLLMMEVEEVRRRVGENYVVVCVAPTTPKVAPPGYYQLSIVYDGVPSRSKWVRIIGS